MIAAGEGAAWSLCLTFPTGKSIGPPARGSAEITRGPIDVSQPLVGMPDAYRHVPPGSRARSGVSRQRHPAGSRCSSPSGRYNDRDPPPEDPAAMTRRQALLSFAALGIALAATAGCGPETPAQKSAENTPVQEVRPRLPGDD